ncbi:MAG: chemotaxis protein CheX [Bacillota bacterium]|nr:chemotaxis protein CheX [Bacillota bacterium]
MKAEIVNSFISAALKVVNSFSSNPFSVGRPFVRQSTYATNEIIIILGITGEIKGQACFSMSNDLAKSIASAMMMGMPVMEIDDMAKSALSELGNMIMGNSATLLFNNGIKTDITPPSLLTGTAMEVSSADMETICVPLNSGVGTIEFDIGIKTN